MASIKMTKEEIEAKVASELAKTKKMAERELAKIKSHVTGKMKEVEKFIEKNPEKAALIGVGIGAALGAALALFAHNGKGKRK